MSLLAEKVKTSFKGKQIAVIGDLVADQFLHGTIARVSREAPVFILKHDETETRPGGAANAAANIAALGGEPLLVGLISGDVNGIALRAALKGSGVEMDTDKDCVAVAIGYARPLTERDEDIAVARHDHPVTGLAQSCCEPLGDVERDDFFRHALSGNSAAIEAAVAGIDHHGGKFPAHDRRGQRKEQREGKRE